MKITKESLDQNILSLTNEQEAAKAAVYRTEGALQAFKFILAELEKPEPVVETPSEG